MFKNNQKKVLLVLICILIIGVIITFSLFPKSKNKLLTELDNLVLTMNDIYTIKAITYPNEEKITYSSNNEEILKVDENGNIEALKEGNAQVTIKSKSNKRIINVNVNNSASNITGIKIKEETLALSVSDIYLLELNVYPETQLTPFIIIESNNEDVIQVKNGYLKALKQGSSQITVTAIVDDEELSDTINVVVEEKENVSVKDISFYEEVVTIGLNETYNLNPIIIPNNATNKDIIYVIENEDIIEINENTIKAKAKGETKVTAISSNNKTFDFVVNVTASDGLVLNISDITIAKGEEYKLKSNFISGVDWYSSNNKVAIVDNNGTVKGISNGTAIITIINKYGKINTVKVNVDGDGVLVSNITLSQNEISLLTGTTYRLVPNITPSNATNKKIIYETTDNRVAMVSDDGVITAKLEGMCYITAYSSNNKSAVVKVFVKKGEIVLDSLEISPSNISIEKGDSYALTVNFIPSNVSENNVIWESTNENIVKVDNGLITGIKTGTAFVRATSNGVTNEVEVIVKDSIIDIASVDIKEENISIKEGDKVTLTTSYTPSNATNKSFIFKSSNESVAIINNKGVITALKEGSTTITVSSINGKKDQVRVVVIKNDGGSTSSSITSVIISTENVNMQLGETKQIRATILPLNANQNVTWISNDTNVVKVENGLLTAINNGSTTIAAIASNGMIAKANVVVSYPPITDSGNKLFELNSNTLITSMTQDPNSKIKIIRIWVADPYKQFHKLSYTPAALVDETMNKAIQEQGLQNSILVGGNGSFSKSNISVGNFNITEGNILLNNPGGPNDVDFGNAVFYAGINSQGKLNAYCSHPDKNCSHGQVAKKDEIAVFDAIVNDGVKSTVSMSYENLLIVNGKSTGSFEWDPRFAIRHTLCQVNTNNFIMTISSNGDLVREVAALLGKLNCQTAINLDGGGSANSFYKNKGASTVTVIRGTNRPRTEIIYFAEF